ncbi:catalase [Vibrio lentus]|nr:catalase [Vibrio lentus]
MKFHFKSQQGIKTRLMQKRVTRIGDDRESHQRDCQDSIDNQAISLNGRAAESASDARSGCSEKVFHNPFDLTKIWPHADYPLIEVVSLN